MDQNPMVLLFDLLIISSDQNKLAKEKRGVTYVWK